MKIFCKIYILNGFLIYCWYNELCGNFERGIVLSRVISLILMLFLSSCESRPLTPIEQARERGEQAREKNQLSTTPFFMGEVPADDSPYSQGFRDGCNSALYGVGFGGVSSMRDQIYLDPNRKVTDNMYHKGWNTGQNYCTYYLDVDPL